MTTRRRLDQIITELGITSTPEEARKYVLAGRITVAGKVAISPSQTVLSQSNISLTALPDYYSRGGIKLAHAIDDFELDLKGLVGLDIGSSTGGFTHCLVEHGVSKVYSLDVGYGQLDYRLREDPRVIVMERVNASYPFVIDEKADIITIDVSFISLTKILPAVSGHLAKGGIILALIKPQYEARPDEIGKGGIIRSPSSHAEIIGRIISWVVYNGFRLRGLEASRITGSGGNREFFMMLNSCG